MDTRKSGVGTGMVRRRLAELMMVFDLTVEVPVTVIVKFPDGAEGPTATLSLVVADAPASNRLDWARLASTPAGTPDSERDCSGKSVERGDRNVRRVYARRFNGKYVR